ncbi:AEC family transporter [uncultured Selenomonas sp.]|uniref:AEC family transporter n=1 Tax=uncultured Selenomonas sp. TaxID=159275 RepID=UPI0028D60797|nr:AEC family transporter [uncultured Selenomonas sp.]
MFSNFLVALGGVVPLFCLMAVGVFVRRARLLTEDELCHVNSMVFRVFFFFMMFYNIYISDPGTAFQPMLMAFGAGGVLLTALVFTGVVCRIEPDNARRGPMIQSVFRGNYVLMGIPLVSNIFGDGAIAVPTMMIAVIVPLYNVLGVLVLETFRGGRFDLLPILRGMLMNPMILGAIAGALCRLVQLPIPAPVLKPVAQIAAATTPVALIILGASFHGGSYHTHLRQLIFSVASRLIIVPAIVLPLAIALGFRDVELVTLVAVFATPCAVAGFAMAQQMQADAELAGNCVVYSSALSCFTIFGWVFLLKTMAFF